MWILISKSGVGLKVCISDKLPGGGAAVVLDHTDDRGTNRAGWNLMQVLP